MLNSIVTIICIALITSFYLVLVFQKPENLDKGPAKKRLPRDRSGGHVGAIRLS